MKKILYTLSLLMIGLSIVIISCKKESAPEKQPENPSFVEEFDTLANVLEKGWAIVNNSKPIGSSSWNPGVLTRIEPASTKAPASVVNEYPFFAASATYSGKDFLMSTFDAGDLNSTISNWLISKPVLMKNGDVIEFFTRSAPASFNTTNKADRLQVRVNTTNNSTDVGNTAMSVGMFSTTVLDINPTYQSTGASAFPKTWTKYTVTITGLVAPVYRRFAFRHFVENGGQDGSRSYAVGIDKVEFISK